MSSPPVRPYIQKSGLPTNSVVKPVFPDIFVPRRKTAKNGGQSRGRDRSGWYKPLFPSRLLTVMGAGMVQA